MADLLSPQTWPFCLAWLPQPAYLVGGGVRDALRGVPSTYLDLDFVLPSQPVEVARAIARHYRAGFVLLDAEREIARVVFADSTADFALQVGPSLTADLHRRDFTVNAIAYNPHTKEILDPLDGQADLRQGLLRMVAPENLAEDPLRLLRAYRQAAQLNFRLEPNTQTWIRELAPHLALMAAERVRSELSYLLSTAAGTPLLKAAWADGLFQAWFPTATAFSLEKVAAMDAAAAQLASQWPSLGVELHRCLNERAKGGESARRTLLANAKLVYVVGQSPAQALADLQRLKYSRAEINLVLTLLKNLPLVSNSHHTQALSRADQYFLFQSIGSAFPVLAVLALAEGTALDSLTPLITAWLDPQNSTAHPHPLVTGKDLLLHLQIPPGPAVGQLLTRLEVAQAQGLITTSDAALALARSICQEQDLKPLKTNDSRQHSGFDDT
jgi:tRNA nucleotidyltransferase (CCA-adding enzyme)